MTDPLNRLLDQARLPAPPTNFADRIVAHATAQPQQTPVVPPHRRDRRGGWMRRPRVLAAFIGANLLVASAVAATIAGGGLPQLRKAPIIAPVIAALTPAPKPRPVHHKIAPKPAPAPTEVAAAPPSPAPEPLVRQPQRPVEILAQRLSTRRDMLASRIEARQAAGLPVPPRMEQRAMLQTMQVHALELKQQGQPVPPQLRREIWIQRYRVAPPGERARMLDRLAERRAMFMQRADTFPAARRARMIERWERNNAPPSDPAIEGNSAATR